MRPPRLAVLGAGRMGREVASLAEQRSIEVTAVLGRGSLLERDRVLATLDVADVAVEFTAPEAAVDHIDLCLEAGCPVAVGTTGWYDRLEEVTERVRERRGGLLWAPNFSLGIAFVKDLCRRAGQMVAGLDGYDVHLCETHHAGKKDAPSGTALLLRDALRSGAGPDVPITSVRIGHVPGRHEVWIDGMHEQVVLSHEARSRLVFADGALRAALWLRGREGTFTLDDVIKLERT